MTIIIKAMVENIMINLNEIYTPKDAYNQIEATEVAMEKRLNPVSQFYGLYAFGADHARCLPFCLHRFERDVLNKKQVLKPLIKAVCSMALSADQLTLPKSMVRGAVSFIRFYTKEIKKDNWAIKYNGITLYQAASIFGQINLSIAIIQRLLEQNIAAISSFRADVINFYEKYANHPDIKQLDPYLPSVFASMKSDEFKALAKRLYKKNNYPYLKRLLSFYLSTFPGDKTSMIEQYISSLAREYGSVEMDEYFARPRSPKLDFDPAEQSKEDKKSKKGHKDKKRKAEKFKSNPKKRRHQNKMSSKTLKHFDDFLKAHFNVKPDGSSTEAGDADVGAGATGAATQKILASLSINHQTRFADQTGKAFYQSSVTRIPAKFNRESLNSRHLRNSHWQNPSTSHLATKSCIVLYRGVHWLRSSFSTDGTEPAQTQIAEGINLRKESASKAPDDMLSQHLLRTKSEDQATELARLNTWYKTISTRAIPAGLKLSYTQTANYPNLKAYVHSYFSNDYDRFGHSARRGDHQLGLDGHALLGHPFVCCSKDHPDHALRYAMGQKTASNSHYQADRLRPRYQRTGAPLNQFVGEISTIILTLDDLNALPHYDVWYDYARYQNATGTRIVAEREFSVVGKIDKKHIMCKQTVSWPDFSMAWSSVVESNYGLNDTQFKEYKLKLTSALEKIDKESDRSAYKAFKNNLAKSIINHCSAKLQRRTREILQAQMAELICKRPEGLIDNVPASLDWLKFLRFIHKHATALTEMMSLSKTERQSLPLNLKLHKKASTKVQLYLELLRVTGRISDLDFEPTIRRLMPGLLTLLNTNTPTPKPKPKAKPKFSAGAGKGTEQARKEKAARTDLLPEPLNDTALIARPAMLKRLHTDTKQPLDDTLRVKLMLLLASNQIDELHRQKLAIVADDLGKAFWEDWLKNYQDSNGQHVLHHLAKLGSMQAYRVIVLKRNGKRFASGLRTIVLDNNENVPLHIAARYGHDSMVSVLLAYHAAAYADRSNKAGYTPLQLAILHGHTSTVLRLLEHHCDLLAKGNAGDSALDLLKRGDRKHKLPMAHDFALVLETLEKVIRQCENLHYCLSDENKTLQHLLEQLKAFNAKYPEQQALIIDYIGKMRFNDQNLAYLLCRDGCIEFVKAFQKLGLSFYGLVFQNRKIYRSVSPITASLTGLMSKHAYYKSKQAAFIGIIEYLLSTHDRLIETLNTTEACYIKKQLSRNKLKVDPVKTLKKQIKAKLKKKKETAKKPVDTSQLQAVLEQWSHWFEDESVLKAKQASFLSYLDSSHYEDFKENVENYDLKLQDVLPDGNCFFHAVLDQLQLRTPDIINRIKHHFPGEFTHKTLRQIATGGLMHAALNGELAGYTDHPEGYITKMAEDREWADGIIIATTARVLGVTIVLINNDGSTPTMINAGCEQALFLGYQVGHHFLSTRGEPNELLRSKLLTTIPGDELSLASVKEALNLIAPEPSPAPTIFRPLKKTKKRHNTSLNL